VPLPALTDSHGGGDLEILRVLGEHLATGEHEHLVSSLEASLPSHALAFLAERSRQLGGVRIEVPGIFMPEPAVQPSSSPVPPDSFQLP
jgi:hypothetical protein